MAREVFLHVGPGKTGSSYIQSFLASNIENLRAAGICYPTGPGVDLAKQQKISSGNISPDGIVRRFDAIAGRLAGADQKLLFSNESLFGAIVNDPELLAFFTRRGYRVNILMFIRDPLEFLRSAYIQSVKRSGSTKSLDDYCRDNDCHLPLLSRVGTFLDLCQKHDTRVEVRNYDQCKHDLIAPLQQFLGIDTRGFEPVSGRVNRSLSDAEIQLQIAFNRYYGPASAAFVSDALCNEAPTVAASRMLPSQPLLDRFIANVNAEMTALNDRFDPAFDRYRLIDPAEISAPPPGATCAFTQQQIDILARSISQEIKRSRDVTTFGRKALLRALLRRIFSAARGRRH